jgi:hypothetical protein
VTVTLHFIEVKYQLMIFRQLVKQFQNLFIGQLIRSVFGIKNRGFSVSLFIILKLSVSAIIVDGCIDCNSSQPRFDRRGVFQLLD